MRSARIATHLWLAALCDAQRSQRWWDQRCCPAAAAAVTGSVILIATPGLVVFVCYNCVSQLQHEWQGNVSMLFLLWSLNQAMAEVLTIAGCLLEHG